MSITSEPERRADEHYCLFETALGLCGAAWSGQGLTRLNLPEASRAAIAARLRRRGATASDDPPPAVREAIAEVQRYCAGERVDFGAVTLDLADSAPFARSVYAQARLVGWGCTTTYGEIARCIGAPRDTREVGQALSHNPIPIIVPCHRVLAKDGMGGFSAHGGTSAKERLLALEGLRFEKQLPLAL